MRRVRSWRPSLANWRKIARRVRVPLGFLFAAAYLWLAKPILWSLITGACFVLGGLALRAFASGHVRKNEQLTTTGPYAYTRNPLYFGSLVLTIGFVIASRSWIVAAIAAAFFFGIYVPVIRGEEEFLRKQFPEFEEYSRHVPRLLPRFTPYRDSPTSFDQHLYWKHREYNAAIGAVLVIFALVAKAVFLRR